MFRKRNHLGIFYRLLHNHKEHIAMLENSLQDRTLDT